MEKSDQKQKQHHEQHILLPQQQQQQQQQQKQDYSDHGCRDRAPGKTQHRRKVQAPVIREVDEEVKLAATAISLNVRLRSSSNMPHHMQERALRRTRSLIDSAAAAAKALSSKPRPNPTHIARALKKEFDSLYGPAWHCVVGKSFGSFVTHSPGGFLYFSIDESLSVLLFKTEVQVVTEQQPQKPAN
ncbi:PREDICTED: uncharacterized protein LOC101310973 [Fragaria vesca subsp. vesca]|uniref:uncharacterized protein LOC101310973 n=1 Tax=Fragaria vesca subsp. vesca TaxID=101020 RepID=UPI0002C363A7|nr:PREDICTED: uncharacterized protein LOC101310973 [Fragaria vesca subsp. vesca]